MKLWLISQNVNTAYDTYDSAVVAAETEEEAKTMHPQHLFKQYSWNKGWDNNTWCNIKHVKVEYLGETDKQKGVILASFHAG
jgi:hypothetical protein